jgi:hypothetical protein
MCRRAFVFCFVCSLSIAVSRTSHATDAGQSVGVAIGDLAIGYSYLLDLQRDTVTSQSSGLLVKANDQWLVFRGIGYSQNGGKLTPNTVYFWIPRDAVTKITREPVTAKKPPVKFAEESPPKLQYCKVTINDAGKLNWKEGDISEINGKSIILAGESIPKETVLEMWFERPGNDWDIEKVVSQTNARGRQRRITRR